ncbi:MAG TPA: type II secretion system protein [Kiritimatiellia bacterium]|nr:type II secretion system protein [Kiritimatiellia bacterium]
MKTNPHPTRFLRWNTRGCRGAGFTVLELLAVIAVLFILALLLMPAFVDARAGVTRMNCASRQRQAVNGILLYAADHGGFLPPVGNHRNWKGLGRTEWWLYPRWVGAYIDFRSLGTNLMQVIRCPSIKNSNIETGGIGLNHDELGIWLGPARQEFEAGFQPQMHDVRKPADTAVLADVGYLQNPTELNPALWRFTQDNGGAHLFRTPNNSDYNTDPQRAVNRHGKTMVAAYMDGHVGIQSVTNLGFQYTRNHALAKWDL